uniref:Uncharacterized protein n=1 Tax=Rhizophora mucronata TaxID=61149 RepID=A0A2P2NSS5_RHIMU
MSFCFHYRQGRLLRLNPRVHTIITFVITT